MNIKRYHILGEGANLIHVGDPEVEQSDNGYWVKHDDHAAEIARLRKALEDIKQGPEPMNDYLKGIRCGVEDRDLQNYPYEAAEYGYEKGLDYCQFIASNALANQGEK